MVYCIKCLFQIKEKASIYIFPSNIARDTLIRNGGKKVFIA